MYVKKNYGFFMTLNWSKMPLIFGCLYALVILLLERFLPVELALPWQPISIVGIAVAFYLGFKNNSSYDRTWEARKIYGGIVNSSRSFAASAVAFIKGKDEDQIKKELIYRHVAWLTALRTQLRLSKPWEHKENRLVGLYAPTVCEDYTLKLEDALGAYLSASEVKQVTAKSNVATQILKNQFVRLQELRDQAYFEDFRHMQIHSNLEDLYDYQGMAERIKNFPFPRQYASTTVWLTLVFSILVPFGLLDVFSIMGWAKFVLAPLFSGVIIWVFFLMEKIGDYSENPFEGTYNDVPITNISRGIEIDIREMINDTDIPAPTKEENGFLM